MTIDDFVVLLLILSYLLPKYFLATAWINAHQTAVFCEEKIVSDPGMRGYFTGKNGLEFLAATQDLCYCVVSSNGSTASSKSDPCFLQPATPVRTPISN